MASVSKVEGDSREVYLETYVSTGSKRVSSESLSDSARVVGVHDRGFLRDNKPVLLVATDCRSFSWCNK